MHKSPPSAHSWLVVFCAVISAGLMLWSKRLPEATWEKSTPGARQSLIIGPTSTPLPEPGSETDSTPAETAAASPTPAPMTAMTSTETSAAPSASASPDPISATDTPSPAPTTAALVAAASPAPTSDTTAPANPAPTAQPSPTAMPSDAALAGPLPERSTTGPVTAATSLQPTTPAAPTPMDIMEIAKQPHLWPRQVLLRSSVRFAVIIKGMNAGNIQVPAGRPVNLRKVDLDGTVEIELPGSQGSVTKVKEQDTDLVARVNAGAAAREKASFGPPPTLKTVAPSETIPTL